MNHCPTCNCGWQQRRDPILVVVSNYKLKPAAWRQLREMFPQESIYKASETEMRLELRDGTVFLVKSPDAPESLLGYTATRWYVPL